MKNPKELVSIKMREAMTVDGAPRAVGDVVKVAREVAEIIVRRRGAATFEIDAAVAKAKPAEPSADPAPAARRRA